MSKQNIHIAMGSLAYAIAKADGTVQGEEKKVLQQLAQQEFELSDADNEHIASMFVRMEKDNIGLEDAYSYALDVLEANRHEYDFDEAMKRKCLNFMIKVSEAFDGIAMEEIKIIERFKEDLKRF